MFFAPVIRHAAYHPALRTVDRSFERFFNDAVLARNTNARNPGFAFEQDETSFTLKLDVPGVAKEQLSIGIEGAVVRIESLADAPRQVKAAYELPQDIDASASIAKLENGVLTLKLTKKLPVSNVTQIAIH